MRKILPILLAALIIFPAIAEAVTIPNFLKMSSKIEFTGMSSRRSSKASYDEYSYKCSGGALSGYAEKYVKLLTSEYHYKIVEQTKSKDGGEWRLSYTKSIPLKSNGKSIGYIWSDSKPKSWHIRITTHADSAEITLARGIYMD